MQDFVRREGPKQKRPPFFGAAAIARLERIKPSHEQELHSDHSSHLQATGKSALLQGRMPQGRMNFCEPMHFLSAKRLQAAGLPGAAAATFLAAPAATH
jgi:hypothetical protein